jgi:hypothetical protein
MSRLFKLRPPFLGLLLTAGGSAWYAMQILHESGHVLHAWFSGGEVERVVLRPFDFSRTDLGFNPHPLFVAWGGVIWGSALPLAIWLVGRRWAGEFTFLLRFLAGFCLLANGAYLASALSTPVGDVQDLLRLGAPRIPIIAFGLIGAFAGLTLWSPLGPAFGTRGGEINRSALWVTTIVFAGLFAAMAILAY